jgi:CheY-like chemotaxis protein
VRPGRFNISPGKIICWRLAKTREQRSEVLEILLAEDDEDHIFLIQKAISSAKNGIAYRFHVVKDGVECLEYVRQEGRYQGAPRPDLILLDIKMPKKDGLEVLEELKSDPKTKTIPVIMLTSSANETDILKSYGLGSNSYITKPLAYQEFVQKMKMIPEYWGKVNTLPPKP